TKEDVIKAVWPDVTVSDESLTQCISEVRRALDDKNQQIIKTIPRRGYLMDVYISTGGETAPAQQAMMPVVGFLRHLGQNDRPDLTDGFRRGLSEAGYVESRNVAIEYCFAENQYDRLPALAADLVDRKAAVILAAGGGNSALAAKTSTSTIPIVFLTGGGPVQEGIVSHLHRTAGHGPGVSLLGFHPRPHRLGALH